MASGEQCCQLCLANFVCLFDLVSHVRAAHSVEHLNLVCRVDGCPRMFRRTNTWYKHVIKRHREEYDRNHDPDTHVSSSDSQSEGEDAQDVADDNMEDINYGESFEGESSHQSIPQDIPQDSSFPLYATNDIPPFISDEAVAGKLIKIREQYLLSHAAVGEVVELVQTVCNNMAMRSLSAILQSGEALGMGFFSRPTRNFRTADPPNDFY